MLCPNFNFRSSGITKGPEIKTTSAEMIAAFNAAEKSIN
jgi:hypothetical protein